MDIESGIMTNKQIYYDIYKEFYDVNKYRELKSIIHHGNNRLDHISRVAKMSFYMSKFLHLDYVSCTRGALLHDFFTSEDLNRNDESYKEFLNDHPSIALDNANYYFEVNDIEKDIITSHMYPVVKGKPKYKESEIVCFCDKVVSVFEFFKYQLAVSVFICLVLFAKIVN